MADIHLRINRLSQGTQNIESYTAKSVCFCPQPGPTFQVNDTGLSFGPKSSCLAIAYLNIRGLLNKMDQVSLIMGGGKSFDIVLLRDLAK